MRSKLHCTRPGPTPHVPPRSESRLFCKVCGAIHRVDWQTGWCERLDAFVDAHYEEHGACHFGIQLRP
ncbi:MAG: hypothetical protein ACJ735_00195 [Actinomycetes bacterium]